MLTRAGLSLRHRLDDVAALATLAPSAGNRQPWNWSVAADALALYAEPDRLAGGSRPGDHDLMVSLGATLLYARVALSEAGLDAVVTASPPRPGEAGRNPREPVARIQVLGSRWQLPDEGVLAGGVLAGGCLAEGALAEAARRRHHGRPCFTVGPVPPGAVRQVRAAAETEGGWVEDVGLEMTTVHRADLVARPDWAEPPEPLYQTCSPEPWRGAPRGAVAAGLAPTGGILLLGVAGEHPLDDLMGGQALARVLLTASVLGLGVSPAAPAAADGWGQASGLPGPVRMVLRVGAPLDGPRLVRAGSRRRLGDVVTARRAGWEPVPPARRGKGRTSP
jgi:nitroreductase